MKQVQINACSSGKFSISINATKSTKKSKDGKKRKNEDDASWKPRKRQLRSMKIFQQPDDDGEKATIYSNDKSIEKVTLPLDVLINIASYVTSPEKATMLMSIDRELLSHRNHVMSSFIQNMNEQNAIKLFFKFAKCGNINAWKWFHLYLDFEDLIHRTFGQWCQSALGWAAQYNHLDLVKLIIKKNDNLEYVHYKPDCGFSALHLAVMNGHLEIVEYFIKCDGVDIERKEYNDTLLHRAARAGHIDIAKLLLDHGAVIDNKDNTTPLLEPNNKRCELLEYLVKCGGMIKRNYGLYYSALHCAAANGHAEIVELLAKRGARLDTKTIYGQTAIQLAAKNGHECVVDILQKLNRGGAGMNIQTNECCIEEWQSPNDMNERQKMISEIVSLIRTIKPDSQQEWFNKIPRMARWLEEPLYRSAASFQAYKDLSTIKKRLCQLAHQINSSRTRRFRPRANAIPPQHL